MWAEEQGDKDLDSYQRSVRNGRRFGPFVVYTFFLFPELTVHKTREQKPLRSIVQSTLPKIFYLPALEFEIFTFDPLN